MKQRCHTPEQIIRKLREADRLLARARKSPRPPSNWRVSDATIILAGPGWRGRTWLSRCGDGHQLGRRARPVPR
jgi:hypothetical protein